MTPDELAAIRARDAHLSWFRVESTPSHNPRDDTFGQRARDRRALLAEVDRLTLLVLMDRISTQDNYLDNHAAMLIERARIRAAVEGLPVVFFNVGMPEDRTMVELLDRAAVLAAIDGEAT